MAEYGYIRVSSRDQNEDRQRIAMRDAGVVLPLDGCIQAWAKDMNGGVNDAAD